MSSPAAPSETLSFDSPLAVGPERVAFVGTWPVGDAPGAGPGYGDIIREPANATDPIMAHVFSSLIGPAPRTAHMGRLPGSGRQPTPHWPRRRNARVCACIRVVSWGPVSNQRHKKICAVNNSLCEIPAHLCTGLNRNAVSMGPVASHGMEALCHDWMGRDHSGARERTRMPMCMRTMAT